MRGLVLGKFLPYHEGHAHLIREARRQVEDLVVLVCSLPSDAIPGGERFQWVRRAHPDCRVAHVTDVVPQTPDEHEEFWSIWAALIARYAGRIDRVFTSESYGDELGRRIGASHICVDVGRRRVAVSGTAIRRDPAGNWRFITEDVRAYLTRRVAIVGPESSGKTTLARYLADEFNTNWVPEYGREYCVDRDARGLSHDDFEAIAWGQATTEDACARAAGPVMVCDTELHTTCTWSDLILGERRAWLTEAARARNYSAIIFLDGDLPWVDDGTRVLSLRRTEHVLLLKRELAAAGRSWHFISGSPDQRFLQAATVIRALLAPASAVSMDARAI